ncbi:MAG: hypothetical protein KC593_01950 [Myxococcales bacterium]|nr:hypothetical protein [Myxococcales bacterium]MCB9627712.1 hypothetical protein [Sandaracinaceae bacterium]
MITLAPSRSSLILLAVLTSALLGCGGDETPANASSAAAPTPPPGAPGASPASATPPPAGPTATPVPPAAPALPAPVPPASWHTTMGELTVDGTTVRDVSATCGMFAMMPVVQVMAGATAGCAERSGVQLAAQFEGGRLVALEATGEGAACVRDAVIAATTSVSCQFQFTFGDAAPAAPAP